MDKFINLTNAAREFIAERINVVEENAFGDYGPEDVASVHRESMAIETEIERLGRIVESARAIAGMRHPSIEKILRRQGFGYEADRIANLVRAVDEVLADAAKKDAD